MKKLLNISLLIILLFTIGCSDSNNESIAQSKNNESVSKNAELKWYKFDEGVAKGVKENKYILVDFYTDWCHWCEVMDEKTFNDEKVANKLNDKFVTIRIDAESRTEKANFKGTEYTNMELTRAFKVTGFPSIAFISPEKEIITVIPGYIPAEQFYYILGYIEQECFKQKMSLEEYIKMKGDCDSLKTKKSS